ncbi:MAG: GlxA family transcriptional regulator [Rhodobacteraceae bacterium]|nr:GlxA family transcriptional regulator [Paracoccaceae bacterium]
MSKRCTEYSVDRCLKMAVECPEMDLSAEHRQTVDVRVLLIHGFPLMSYAGVVEPLRAANLIGGETLYRIAHCGVGERMTASSSGNLVPVRPVAEQATEPDYLFVVAGGNPYRVGDPSIFACLRQAARRKVTICGVSGGPVVMARAGIMSGYRMTVHWEHAPALQESMTDIYLERSLFVVDRDRITCAGGIASLDLMHTLIVRHNGNSLANRVSDWFLHTQIREPEGTQRSGLVERYGTTRRPLIAALSQMENHIADPLTLDQIAILSGVGMRHLNRLFRSHLDVSPMEHYRTLRLEHARRLLLGTTLSVTEIALATGFSGSSHFTCAFRTLFGMAPTACRATEGT